VCSSDLKGNTKKNRIEQILAQRYLKGLEGRRRNTDAKRRKGLGKYSAEKLDEEMFERKLKKTEIIDLLKNSELPKGQLIRDVLHYGC
jgi:hypothetical protein